MAHTLISAFTFEGQQKGDLYEFGASLVYMASSLHSYTLSQKTNNKTPNPTTTSQMKQDKIETKYQHLSPSLMTQLDLQVPHVRRRTDFLASTCTVFLSLSHISVIFKTSTTKTQLTNSKQCNQMKTPPHTQNTRTLHISSKHSTTELHA